MVSNKQNTSSVPLKRKDFNIQMHAAKTINSEASKRKRIMSKKLQSQACDSTENESDFEETGLFYLVEYIDDSTEYTIVQEKHISIDQDNVNFETVKHLGKKHRVSILKKGSISSSVFSDSVISF